MIYDLTSFLYALINRFVACIGLGVIQTFLKFVEVHKARKLRFERLLKNYAYLP